MKNKKRAAVIAMTVSICLIAAAMFFSYIKFNSVNLPKIAYAIAAVSSGSEDYVVIRGNYKKVIIADPNDPNAFYKYLEANGYKELEGERMGSMHTVEKDGVTELVYVHGNAYYRLFLWDK